jgi:hypothetical protein
MAEFKKGVEQRIDASIDTVSVDMIDGAAPAPGKYKFSLVVVGKNDLQSDPREIIVTVVNLEAVLNAVSPDGVPLPDNKVKAGQKFSLSAKGSIAVGEEINGYIFTLLEGP